MTDGKEVEVAGAPVTVESIVMPTPCGVVALLIGKDGRAIASASDFNASGYGGFSLHDSQKMRVKRSLAHEALRELASPILCEVVDSYDAEKIMDAMCSRGGCRVETVAVGHEA